MNGCQLNGKDRGSSFPRSLPPTIGALGATRTHDPLLRKQVLYPLSYEGTGSILYQKQAGREGFEPSTGYTPVPT